MPAHFLSQNTLTWECKIPTGWKEIKGAENIWLISKRKGKQYKIESGYC